MRPEPTVRSLARWLVFAGLATVSPLSAQTVPDSNRVWPFAVSSLGSGYPFTMSLRGSYRVFGDSLVIEITDGTAVSQIPDRFGERGYARDVTLVVSLGTGTPQSWTSSGDTPSQPIGPVLAPASRIPVPPMRFVVRHKGARELRESWLAFELGVIQQLPVEGFRPGPLVSYACTEDYVLGPTAMSQKRAQAQRADYSRVC